MTKYYVNDNAQSTGEHEVHTESCSHGPDPSNRTYLGNFTNCKDAVQKAKQHYDNVDGCYYCSELCHKKQGSANDPSPFWWSLVPLVPKLPLGNPSLRSSSFLPIILKKSLPYLPKSFRFFLSINNMGANWYWDDLLSKSKGRGLIRCNDQTQSKSYSVFSEKERHRVLQPYFKLNRSREYEIYISSVSLLTLFSYHL